MASSQRSAGTPVSSLSRLAAPSGPDRLRGRVRTSRPVVGSVVMPNVLSIQIESGSFTKVV
jgi:hypothetical protein